MLNFYDEKQKIGGSGKPPIFVCLCIGIYHQHILPYGSYRKRDITRINRFYIAVLLVLHGFIFPIDNTAELLDIGISELTKSCKDLVCSGVVGGCYVCLKLGNKRLRFGRSGTRAACLARGKLGKDSHKTIVCRCPFLFPVVLSLQGIIYHPRRG